MSPLQAGHLLGLHGLHYLPGEFILPGVRKEGRVGGGMRVHSLCSLVRGAAPTHRMGGAGL